MAQVNLKERLKATKLYSQERGAVFAWMVFLLPIFILLAGLVIDLSTIFVLVNRVQTTMDAAGTSAVTFSMKEESMRDDSELTIDEDTARDRFLWYLRKNLKLTSTLSPEKESFLEGSVLISNMEIEESPPHLKVTLEVPFRTCIMKYLVEEVKVPISAEYIIDKK